MFFPPGVGGLEGDGDVYKPENLREFRQFVLNSTDGKGVHFVMADGVSDGRKIFLQEWVNNSGQNSRVINRLIDNVLYKSSWGT